MRMIAIVLALVVVAIATARQNLTPYEKVSVRLQAVLKTLGLPAEKLDSKYFKTTGDEPIQYPIGRGKHWYHSRNVGMVFEDDCASLIRFTDVRYQNDRTKDPSFVAAGKFKSREEWSSAAKSWVEKVRPGLNLLFVEWREYNPSSTRPRLGGTMSNVVNLRYAVKVSEKVGRPLEVKLDRGTGRVLQFSLSTQRSMELCTQKVYTRGTSTGM